MLFLRDYIMYKKEVHVTPESSVKASLCLIT